MLSSFDLARIREGWVDEGSDNSTVDQRITPSIPASISASSSTAAATQSSSSSPSSSLSKNIGLSFYKNDRFMKVLNASSIYTYTYGAPRVGNSDFVRAFNTMVSHCFCIVNQQDIIARLPRSFNGTFVDYSHVGRTVIIGEKGGDSSSISYKDSRDNELIENDDSDDGDDSGDDKAIDRIWIEGESTSPNPIKDMSIMNYMPSVNILSMVPEMDIPTATLTKLSDSIKDYSNKMVSSLLDSVDLSITKAMSDAVSGYDIRATLTSHGLSIDDLPIEQWLVLPKELNTAFVERELELLNTLLNKTAVLHHLEPSYFEAYCNAMRDRK